MKRSTKLRAALALATCLATGTAALAQPADPIKIGLLLDLSSFYSDVGGRGSEASARMAAEDFGGKVLGRPIEVVVADHQNKADIASSIAREWFDQEGVTALVDVTGSAPALAVMGVARDKDRIVILNGPGATSITNENCTPTTVHYAYDTYALAHSTGQAVTRQGGKSWFFLTADYSFGEELARETTAVVLANGGKVVGNAKVPINTPDFSSFLVQAQASGAQVIGLANGGGDAINSIKQAAEFGIPQGGQTLAGLLVYINDVNSIGLDATQGMVLTSAFYWDMNDDSRAWAHRYFERVGRMPNMSQAGVYSSTMHYLQAVQAASTTDAAPVMKAMRAAPVNDAFTKNGRIREDGLMVHDMYLFQVKKPSESREPWDYYTLKATIPGDQAFPPLSASKCQMVKQ